MMTFVSTSADPPVHPVYLDSPVYSDLSSDVPVQLNHAPDYYGPGIDQHWAHFYDFGGFAPPGDDWENKTYTFFMDGNANGGLDPGETTLQWTIPPNSIRQMEIPQNVTFSGGIHPTISWDPVQHADGYLVLFYALAEDGFVEGTAVLGSSSFITNNFYTYTGDLFKDGKEYAVWVMARENHPWANPNLPPGAMLINRSGYFTKYQAVKIVNASPWVPLLLLDD